MGVWIESHVEILAHPKTGRLRRALGVPRYAAVGILHSLWLWAAQHAETGDLSGLDAHDIAEAVGWEGDPDALLAGLLSAGWVDPEPLRLHNWHQYFGKLLEAKQKSKERSARGRAEQKASSESANVRERTRTDTERTETYANVHGDLDLDRDLDLKATSKTPSSGTLELPREPAQTTASTAVDGSTPPTRKPRISKPSTPYEAMDPEVRGWFDSFWQRYPRHVAKQEAAQAFSRCVHPGPSGLATCKEIGAGLARYREKLEARGELNSEFVAHASTWLNGRRWEDETGPAPSCPGAPKLDSMGGVLRR